MLQDLTMRITKQMAQDAANHPDPKLAGHLGTHFDVMNCTFPLVYTKRNAIVFDVSSVTGRDIEITDIELERVEEGMFVAFFSGFADRIEYGTWEYFKEHPQLSDNLIDALLDRRISIIGIDFAGVRRGKEHTPKDQHCADHNVFIVENLVALNSVVTRGGRFIAHTYPMNLEGYTGLPCRVIAEFE